jgi:hypothetical protein
MRNEILGNRYWCCGELNALANAFAPHCAALQPLVDAPADVVALFGCALLGHLCLHPHVVGHLWGQGRGWDGVGDRDEDGVRVGVENVLGRVGVKERVGVGNVIGLEFEKRHRKERDIGASVQCFPLICCWRWRCVGV